ncbi:hypothetical protein E7V67_013270 [[Empedobacter] haloabium]|uniref:Uncharacterized protein n=1 Tax=[Empedobacter] haloabium TaxID=592317 RepID=A0ABZ1UTK9_9BURK
MFTSSIIIPQGDSAPPRAFAILESTLRSGYIIIKTMYVLAKAKAQHLFQVMD